jgi:peptidoglycan LD-endopeptidase LytH
MHPLFKRSNLNDFAFKIRLDDLENNSTNKSLEDQILFFFKESGAVVLYGGYGEKRSFYQSSVLFNNERENRNIHMGVDYWTKAGTDVYLPLDAKLISAQDNIGYLNYGPTLIFQLENPYKQAHYLLIGHLSRSSLSALTHHSYPAGIKIGQVGKPTENGQWPPHLHIQLISDLLGNEGDFPGLCESDQWSSFQTNCPEPEFKIF